MKSKILIFLVFCCTLIVNGQNLKTETKNQFSINLVAPSLEWEVSIGEKSSIDLKLGAAFAYAKVGSESDFGIFPVFESQYRFYYNFVKRMERGKKTSDNSANYVAILGNVRSGNPIIGDLEIEDDFAFLVGPTWGLQRVYGSGFKLNLNLGAGFGINDLGDSYFSPLIGIQLGWVIAR